MIRKSFFFFLSLGLSLPLFSQTYYPFLEEDKVWVVEFFNQQTLPPHSHQRWYYETGDSLINGKVYKKMGGDSGESVLLREDTLEQIVYIYHGDAGGDHILYNFNASPGDTLDQYNFTILVDSVSTIQLPNGQVRDIFFYSSLGGEYYIEGIGSNVGFHYLSEAIGPPNINLMCVRKDGQDIYGDRCLEVVSTGTPPESMAFRLFPNPTAGKVWIEAQGFIRQYRLQDLMGQTLQSGLLTAAPLDLSDLPPGVYLLLLLDKKGILLKRAWLIRQ